MPVHSYSSEQRDGAAAGRSTKKKGGRHKAAGSSQSSHLDLNPQLLDAVARSKVRVVRRLLLDPKVNPNYQGGEKQLTPLMLACEESDEDTRTVMLDLLLSKGVDVNLQDLWGQTALMKAVLAEDLTAVQMLLKHGADMKIADRDGNIALSYAVEVGDTECIEMLVKEGKKCGPNVDHQNLRGLTPLLIAAKDGNLEAARVLVKGGASLSKRDLEHFMNPLEWMKLCDCFSAEELDFLNPSGKKKNFYRQHRKKKGIKTLTDFFPTLEDGSNSPNVFSMQRNELPGNSRQSFQFPRLHGPDADQEDCAQAKSMFDIPRASSKKQITSPSLSSTTTTACLGDRRRRSISFQSVSSVKTDLYKSSYLTRRQSLLLKNAQSEGYHSGALAPIATITDTQSNGDFPSSKTSRLPPIKK